tara:strand:+ start:74 stop:772 length:699 start_codon:yes stop_codon:yes gene_type:complete
MFANLLLIVPLVIALCGVAVLVYSWTKGVTKESLMATSASATYCVGNTLRHIVMISVSLLSLLLGSFFTYLGFTGSWDMFTIMMSLMGLMGVAGLLPYVVWLNDWFQGSWDQAKEDGLICTDEAGPQPQRATAAQTAAAAQKAMARFKEEQDLKQSEIQHIAEKVVEEYEDPFIEMLVKKTEHQQKKIDHLLMALEEMSKRTDARIKLIHLALDDLEGKEKEDGNENPRDWK